MAELIDADKLNEELYKRVMQMQGYRAQGFEIARNIVNKQPTTTEADIRAKAIDEFAEKLKAELRDSIIPDEQKFQYERKTQERICVQNVAFKIIIKLVEHLAEQLNGNEE